jgi:hypothetical protein
LNITFIGAVISSVVVISGFFMFFFYYYKLTANYNDEKIKDLEMGLALSEMGIDIPRELEEEIEDYASYELAISDKEKVTRSRPPLRGPLP